MDLENDASPVTRGILRLELHGLRSELMNAFEQKLTIRLLQSEGRMEKKMDRLEERMDRRFSEVIETIQDFTGQLRDYQRETITFPNTLDQHGKILKDHENRIRSLES